MEEGGWRGVGSESGTAMFVFNLQTSIKKYPCEHTSDSLTVRRTFQAAERKKKKNVTC